MFTFGKAKKRASVGGGAYGSAADEVAGREVATPPAALLAGRRPSCWNFLIRLWIDFHVLRVRTHDGG